MSKEITIKQLGSVSPYTKGDTNCPGFLIEYGDTKILLDCGNGITRLLKFPDVLDNLHIIISHYHKDHFGDLGAIQYASYVYHNLGLLNNKIKIYLPKNDFASNKDSILCNSESYAEYIDIQDGDFINIDDLKVSFSDNKSHTIESFMVKLENEYASVVYTSDIGTTNFHDLEEFCRGVDLLICESSFLRKHNSNSKTHLTAYDAGSLANRSQVGQLLLNHFWPEEDKSLYLDEAREVFDNVSVSEEGKVLILKREDN